MDGVEVLCYDPRVACSGRNILYHADTYMFVRASAWERSIHFHTIRLIQIQWNIYTNVHNKPSKAKAINQSIPTSHSLFYSSHSPQRHSTTHNWVCHSSFHLTLIIIIISVASSSVIRYLRNTRAIVLYWLPGYRQLCTTSFQCWGKEL